MAACVRARLQLSCVNFGTVSGECGGAECGSIIDTRIYDGFHRVIKIVYKYRAHASMPSNERGREARRGEATRPGSMFDELYMIK